MVCSSRSDEEDDLYSEAAHQHLRGWHLSEDIVTKDDGNVCLDTDVPNLQHIEST